MTDPTWAWTETGEMQMPLHSSLQCSRIKQANNKNNNKMPSCDCEYHWNQKLTNKISWNTLLYLLFTLLFSYVVY